jgi:hypothetical protein
VTLPTGEVREVPPPHAHDARLTLTAPPGEEPIRVAVSVAAENFVIEDHPRVELVVPREGRSNPVTFRLRGERVGPGRIMLDFSQDGAHVGSVDLHPEVVPAADAESDRPARASGQVEIQPRPSDGAPDVVLKVFEHRHSGPGRLQFVLSSSHPGLRDLPVLDGDVGVQNLDVDLAAWIEAQLAALRALAQKPDAAPAEVESALADLGYHLYERLLPERFRRLYWALRERGPKSLLILSDEPHVPWELVRPHERDPISEEVVRDDGFWGERFALTRWLRGRPPSQAVNLGRFFALAAGGGPPGTRELHPPGTAGAVPRLCAIDSEIEALRSLCGATFVLLEPRIARLREALEQGGFDVLHLACHGTFGGPAAADRSAVLLEDGEFSAAMLSPRMAAGLRRSSPLVFFNACHSGRLGFTLLGLGSWGAELIRLGCGAFVGSLWPVRDESAVVFAERFYRSLADGAAIGEAMRQAREEVRRRFPGDPTWLAYCCFADPLARRS